MESTGGAWRLIDLNSSKAQRGFFQEHYTQGLSFFQKEKLTEAVREWEMVSTMDPGYKEIARNLQKAKTLQERLDAIKRSRPQ